MSIPGPPDETRRHTRDPVGRRSGQTTLTVVSICRRRARNLRGCVFRRRGAQGDSGSTSPFGKGRSVSPSDAQKKKILPYFFFSVTSVSWTYFLFGNFFGSERSESSGRKEG